MNLELIRKYLPEFNSYVKGQPLTLGYKTHWGTYEWTDLVWADWYSSINEHIIIVNDEYLPHRKALAESKTIQYNARKGQNDVTYSTYGESWWVDTTEFKYASCFYRIKPEEPKFKIGDWIRQGDRVFQYTYKDLQYDKANPTHCQNDEKWEPRGGEVCIFWDNMHTNEAIIARYSHSERSFYYPLKKPNSCYQNCMPFIGELPPHMKDNK